MRTRTGALAWVALALAGCSATSAPPPSGAAKAATAPAPTTTAQLKALLLANFGPSATLQGTWEDDKEGRRLQHRVCARRVPLVARGDTGLLAICTDSSDGAAGSVELLALDWRAQAWQLAARKPEIESGANGAVIQDPEIVQIGPMLWAIATHGNFISQGYVISGTDLWAVHGSDFVEVASYNIFYDNSGTCGDDDCNGAGINLGAMPLFDKTGTGPAWPLTVHRKGTWCGKPYEHSFRYEFDAAQFRYPTPDGPPEVECAADRG